MDKQKLIKFISVFTCIFVSCITEAAYYSVTNGNDSGVGSFRHAVAQANANPGHDSIDIQTPFISLISGEIEITEGSTIYGQGAIINAIGNSNRVFLVNAINFSQVQIKDLFIYGALNLSVNGGCIQSNTRLRLTNISFNSCSTSAEGGAIYHDGGVSGANLIIEDVTFLGNRAGSNGGSVFVTNTGIISLVNTDFNGGMVSQNGGHIYASASVGSLLIEGGSHMGGIAQSGGSVFSLSSLTSCRVCSVDNNWATNDGGGFVQRGTNTTLSLYQVQVNDNQASFGGAVYVRDGATAYLSESSFMDNLVTLDGGAVYAEDAGISIYNNSIFSNMASRDGGAIALVGESGIGGFWNAINGNTASGNGGGIYSNAVAGTAVVSSGAMFLVNLTVHSNQAGNHGGGLFIESANPGVNGMALRNSTIAYNTAGGQGAGLYANADMGFEANIFDENFSAGIANDCTAGVLQSGYRWIENLIASNSGCAAGSSSLLNTSALLIAPAAVTDMVVAFSSSSPAKDFNTGPFTQSDDILGTPRITPSDIGSFEQ